MRALLKYSSTFRQACLSFFILTNGTDNPALQSAYDEYQQLYEMVQKSKYKADMTLKAILDSVDSLTSFILEDLGKCGKSNSGRFVIGIYLF